MYIIAVYIFIFHELCSSCTVFTSRYSTKLYNRWTESVGEKSQYNLNQPLISRDPVSKLISVNFNPQVMTSNNHVYMQYFRCLYRTNILKSKRSRNKPSTCFGKEKKKWLTLCLCLVWICITVID